MRKDGTSAETAVLRQHLVEPPHYFSDSDSFLEACAAVDSSFAKYPNDDHVVVICTHGDEGTGKLDMGAGNDALPPIHRLFEARPAKLVVYMAVCWGAYAGVMKMFHHGNPPYPTVVGAVVDARSDEGDLLQDEVIEIVDSSGIDENTIQARVEHFNSHTGIDYGQPAARIARSDGALVPPQGAAGISWPLLRDANDDPVEGPFEVVGVDPKRRVASVKFDGQEWKLMAGRLRLANGDKDPQVGQRFRFKAKECPSSNVLQIVGAATLV